MHAFTSDLELEEIGRGLIGRSLPKERWTHAAHFGATFYMLSRHTAEETIERMRAYIREYNESIGGANTPTSGYHETITQASVLAASHWLEMRREEPLHAVCNQLLHSRFGRSDWVLEFWSRELLYSVEARREWVEPDLQPLVFGVPGERGER